MRRCQLGAPHSRRLHRRAIRRLIIVTSIGPSLAPSIELDSEEERVE